MSGVMQSWLLDTMLWTAGLIALVLLLRRPVAKMFGAKAAYALWALPFIRLILPPITLPAWLAPQTGTITTTYTVTLQEPAGGPAQRAVESATAVDWTPYILGAWLLGMAVFLIVRFRFYFQMRAALLEGAVPVGEDGKIRLVETPGTQSPIAFGVFDKVIALPIGFMALTERTQRDLALEHELAHHRAHDLLANFLVQPLFALHWFNPLGWYGWRAMRRDQEAACDARVVATRDEHERAAYASVIASFAAGPNVALAAPMACPVIGEKSIIHRLRSLTMNDISRRRRLTGRMMMGAALLAIPLTASYSYAESMPSMNAPEPPTAPSITGKVAAAPLAPAAPIAPVALQDAPEAPEAPEAGTATDADTQVFVIRETEDGEDGEKGKVIRSERKIVIKGDEKMTKEEREKLMKELREELADVEIEVKEAMQEVRLAVLEMDQDGQKVKIRTECKDGDGHGEWTDKDGKKVIHICKSQVMASALTGLKAAREAIASNTEMEKSMRDEVLQALDEKIENWNSEG